MRRLVVTLLLAACQTSTVGTAGPAPSGTAGTSSCVVQADSRVPVYCGFERDDDLYTCDEGAAPPRPTCRRATQADAYCCPRERPVGPIGEGGVPTRTAPDGVYYGACLSQLAGRDPKKVFNFYTELTAPIVKIQPLRLSTANGPPPTVSKAGVVGVEKLAALAPADGRYTMGLGTVTIPGNANPISGSDVVIEQAAISGPAPTGDRFCGRLSGNITRPIAVQLEPDENICVFVGVQDGSPTPVLTLTDFSASACP